MPVESNDHRCGVCKFHHRRCMIGCVFEPYFRPEETQKVIKIDKVFGTETIGLLLAKLSPNHREAAVNSLLYEAEAWLRNPGQGCAGIISNLEAELKQLKEEVYEGKQELVKYVGPQALTTILQPRPQRRTGNPSSPKTVNGRPIGQLVIREPHPQLHEGDPSSSKAEKAPHSGQLVICNPPPQHKEANP